MATPLPGNGFLGWLGRQVGYVKKAVHTDPGRKVVYRNDNIEEAPHPEKPGVILRRTVTDEVIVEQQKSQERAKNGIQ